MELLDTERAIRSWGGFAKYALLTMSAPWGNPENIYSLRVLPPVTHNRRFQTAILRT
jgi:hypothetical protein